MAEWPDLLVEEVFDIVPKLRAMKHRRNGMIACQIGSDQCNALILRWNAFDDLLHLRVSRVLTHQQVSSRVCGYVWKKIAVQAHVVKICSDLLGWARWLLFIV